MTGTAGRIHEHCIDRGSTVIECSERGQGDAVILLPAGGCRSAYLHPLAEALATSGWRVIDVNLRGAGIVEYRETRDGIPSPGAKHRPLPEGEARNESLSLRERSRGEGKTAASLESLNSGNLSEAMTLHDLAADVAAVIEQLDATSAHIIGHAFGNRVARCLAHDHPQRVRRLVLLASGGRIAPEADLQATARQLARDDIAPAEWQAALRAVYLAPGSDPALVEKLGQTPLATRVQAAAMRATKDDTWEGGGVAPMLILQGTEDRMAPPANGHALARQYGPRVRVADISNAAHLLPLEQPQAVERYIIDFLSGP